MASALPPVKGAAFTFELALVSQADTDVFKTSPTLAAGDIVISIDGGNFTNITTLPTQIQSTGVLPVALTAAEMNGDRITVLCHDAAGDEWQDALVTIYTAAQTFDTTDTAVDDVPTAAENADAVLDALTADHADVGSIGKAIADAGGGSVTVNASVAISATQAETVASGRLALRSYHSFSQVITSTVTVDLTAVGSKLWLALKRGPDDADSAALVLIEKTAGLTVLAGAAYATAAHGSLTVGGSAGAWTITAALDEVATGLLHGYATSGLYAELKALVGTATVAVWDGKAAISQGVVRAVA